MFRPFHLRQVLPPDAFVRLSRRLIGPPDDELQALAAAGLTLRDIGEQVGMSPEGVRWRLRRAAALTG